ncbi:MAG: hypothetical protein Q8P56_04855 [Candidatus Uhrbacteria bacterium]|nr:hypothetical protein [Candidatus Uhrbacteria bacterium]
MSTKNGKKKPAPIKFRQSLFWDVDPKTIDPKKHERYIIERMLNFGTMDELRWMFRAYPQTLIRKTLHRPRSQVDKKSKSLWSLVLK